MTVEEAKELSYEELKALCTQRGKNGGFTHDANIAYGEIQRRRGDTMTFKGRKTCGRYSDDYYYYGGGYYD